MKAIFAKRKNNSWDRTNETWESWDFSFWFCFQVFPGTHLNVSHVTLHLLVPSSSLSFSVHCVPQIPLPRESRKMIHDLRHTATTERISQYCLGHSCWISSFCSLRALLSENENWTVCCASKKKVSKSSHDENNLRWKWNGWTSFTLVALRALSNLISHAKNLVGGSLSLSLSRPLRRFSLHKFARICTESVAKREQTTFQVWTWTLHKRFKTEEKRKSRPRTTNFLLPYRNRRRHFHVARLCLSHSLMNYATI